MSVREAPPYSHQSQGAVELMNAFVQLQIRTLWFDTRKRYVELDMMSNVVPWLIRHAGWLISWQAYTLQDDYWWKLYSHPVANWMRYRNPKPRERRRVGGMWLGKLNYRILGTSSGVVAVRGLSAGFSRKGRQTARYLRTCEVHRGNQEMKFVTGWLPKSHTQGLCRC